MGFKDKQKRKMEIEKQKAEEAKKLEEPEDEIEEVIESEPEEEEKAEKPEEKPEKKVSSATKVRLVDGGLRGKTIHTAYGTFKVDKDGYVTGPNAGRLAENHKVVKS